MLQKPHFIIIGAMKSATSTLHDQLALQDGIFMSTPKEPNFFSDDGEFQKGIDYYRNLFTDATDSDICGESSTHYTKLPTYPNTLARMKEQLPELKLVYVVRHPVERLVSHYIHEWSQNVIKCDINTAISQHPELIEYSLYHKQITPFIEAYGKESLLITFFQQIIHRPQDVLEAVCHHIGYAGTPVWETEEKAKNISSERIRKFPLYNLLVESRLATSLRQNLIPQSFRDLIKSKLTMSERPVLSAENLAMLEKKFNEDLKKFSELAGTTLQCADFNAVTRAAR